MPPKRKAVKKPTPPEAMSSQSSIQNTKSGLDPEAEDRFELELCWCIQQLENCLSSNIQPKEVESVFNVLNVLKSNKSSLIRKRQTMRNKFGDYRQKMAEDEKKFGKSTTTFKFKPAKETSQKAVFLRKANKRAMLHSKKDVSNEMNEKVTECGNSSQNNEEPFKFNFAQVDQS